MRQVTLVVVPIVIAACEASPPRADTLLELDDTVVLEESDGEPIGQPVHVSVNGRGQIAIIDRLNPGVILFTATGERLRKFGARGSGPGEVEVARLAAFLPGDRIGVVGQASHPGIVAFDMESGAYVETIPLESLPSSITPTPDGFLFGALSFGGATSVTALDLSSKAERPFGPIPAGYGYRAGGPIPGIFNHVFAVPLSAGAVAIGYEPLGELVLADEGPGVPERLEIPSPRRRGTPEDLEQQVREAMGRAYVEAFSQGSVLSYMAALDGEHILLVHQDLKPELPATPEAVHVTVVDVNRRQACLDHPVPFYPDTPATFAWDGERLGILQQEIEAATGEAPTVLRWYRLDLSACTWEPLTTSAAG